MKCPFCGKETVSGQITGDGRSQVHFEPNGKKINALDKALGVGIIDVKYSKMRKFSIDADYCPDCRKMMFDTEVRDLKL